MTTCSYGMYVFYCIFAQFTQFPVLDFGLVHSGSEPFTCKSYLRMLIEESDSGRTDFSNSD